MKEREICVKRERERERFVSREEKAITKKTFIVITSSITSRRVGQIFSSAKQGKFYIFIKILIEKPIFYDCALLKGITFVPKLTKYLFVKCFEVHYKSDYNKRLRKMTVIILNQRFLNEGLPRHFSEVVYVI